MYEAFVAAKIARNTGAAIINTCAKALKDKGAGVVYKGKGWNAHLSYKTAQKLGVPEFTHKYVPMAYDAMVKGV
jgi:hypothetical protein